MTPSPAMTITTNIALKSIQCLTCGKYVDVWLIPKINEASKFDEETICGSCGDIIEILIEEKITNV